jgi:hypothetical protein
MKTVVCALKKRDEYGTCHPYGGHGYMKICRRKETLSWWIMGSNLQDFMKQAQLRSAKLHQANTIKKGGPS